MMLKIHKYIAAYIWTWFMLWLTLRSTEALTAFCAERITFAEDPLVFQIFPALWFTFMLVFSFVPIFDAFMSLFEDEELGSVSI